MNILEENIQKIVNEKNRTEQIQLKQSENIQTITLKGLNKFESVIKSYINVFK